MTTSFGPGSSSIGHRMGGAALLHVPTYDSVEHHRSATGQAAVGVWLLVTGLVAIRQALDVTTGKAVVTALVGWVASIAVNALVGGLLGVRVY